MRFSDAKKTATYLERYKEFWKDPTRVDLSRPFINARWMHGDEYVIDRAPHFMLTYDALLTHPFKLRKERPCQSDIFYTKPLPRPDFPNLDDWHSPIFWMETRKGWKCHLEYAEPSEQQYARWRRKKEYQRGVSKAEIEAAKRRAERGPKNWRTERSMRDVAAKLNMYKYGSDGLVQSAKMCQTAYENYRQARLNLAKKHGKAGHWHATPLEGNFRRTESLSATLEKPPAGNYHHRLEDGYYVRGKEVLA